MAIDYNDMVKKVNDLPQFEQEKIKSIVDKMYEDYEDQKLFSELNKIKKEMSNGEYYTEDQINWEN